MPILGRFRLLPLLVLVSLFSFTVRFVDVVSDVKTLDQAMSNSVAAEEHAKEEKTDGEKEGSTGVPEIVIPEGVSDTESIPLPKEQWVDPVTLDLQFSDTQSSVLKELAERRKELDARENRIRQHEALLKVTEKQILKKTGELQALRTQIEKLLGKQSEEEEARLQSLVKIYSGMKPKDAAKIFDNLNMNILIQVVGRMSERKTAPIMAAMDILRAQNLTILLAQQKKLPE